MLRKPVSKPKIALLAVLLAIVAAIIAISLRQAWQMNQVHAEMRQLIDNIPPERIAEIESRYAGGFDIYYSLIDYSGIYAIEKSDQLFDELKMESWAVELSDSASGTIRFRVLDVSLIPKFIDMSSGGWLMNGEIGSSITLTNQRSGSSGSNELIIEVLDRNRMGVVFVLGRPHPTKQ